ncbi:major facilitator superfamily domain-containing protein [Gautieria morchelliformis]|nr:major facilitator superfamily domain-containing protein [Gautieria morchelliformis]
MTSAVAPSSSSSDDFRAAHPVYATEHDPLIGSSSGAHRTERTKKWYRARPLWLVPFAVTASLCRAMTLAPRTEVFIEIACEDLWMSRHHHTRHQHTHASLHTNFSSTHFPMYSDIEGPIPLSLDNLLIMPIPSVELRPPRSRSTSEDDSQMEDDTPINCLAEPSVQAGAAKLQTIMTTTMGLLSAITTGWWGQFGDRHGRTRVITCAVSGLLFTRVDLIDVMFILASNPPPLLRGKAHQLLILAPIVEGLLGGWSTMQGATQAYISDCTSHGSRAHIYSRFTGVFYVGFALGPEIAAFILRNTHTTTAVFYASSLCASINIFLLLFVFPESLSPATRARNIEAAREVRNKALQGPKGKKGLWRSVKVAVKAFIEPIGILGPKPRQHGRGRDWSLTLLAMSLFTFFLSVGLFQIKYLYAKHVYSWDAETLSYYITAVGSTRALHLLILLPAVIRMLKPTPPAIQISRGVTKSNPKAKSSPSTLVSAIEFDLVVAKVSTVLDMLSHLLVLVSSTSAEGLFVAFSMISGFGAGMQPAVQSVALCTLHLRDITEGKEIADGKGGGEVGKLFGAFSVMQAVASMILGPLLFGAVYSLTVATYPKAIFMVGAGVMLVSMTVLLLIRPPRVDVPIEIRVETQVEVDVGRTRGRSRKSKDIRSGLK